jgi:hypothetical protein
MGVQTFIAEPPIERSHKGIVSRLAWPREVQRYAVASSAGLTMNNCASARAVGAAPIRVGDPGYRAGLDRDGDGVACE